MSRTFYSLNITNASGLLLGSSSAGTTFTTGNVGGIVRFSDSSDFLVVDGSAATLTNKNITSTTDNVYAQSLQTNVGTPVNVSAATAPVAGQALTATGPTAANWQSLMVAGVQVTSGNVNSVNNQPTAIETWPTNDNTVYYISSLVAARRTDANTQGAGFGVLAAYSRGAGAGTLTRLGIVDDEVFNRDDNAWSVSTSVASGAIVLVVTANNGANVAWQSSSQVQTV